MVAERKIFEEEPPQFAVAEPVTAPGRTPRPGLYVNPRRRERANHLATTDQSKLTASDRAALARDAYFRGEEGMGDVGMMGGLIHPVRAMRIIEQHLAETIDEQNARGQDTTRTRKRLADLQAGILDAIRERQLDQRRSPWERFQQSRRDKRSRSHPS